LPSAAPDAVNENGGNPLSGLDIFSKDGFVEFVQWSELFLVYEIELINKQEEVTITCVEVCFNPKSANLIKVIAVDMCIYTEQPSYNCPYLIAEVLGEGYTYLIGENGFVIKKVLRPVHECVDIFGGRQLRGTFVSNAVLPEILVTRTSGHEWTLLGSAKLRYSAVQHVQMIEEINSVDCKPFVGVLSFR